MRTALQIPSTVDPPVFHRVGDTYDPAAAGFTANTVAGSPFTSTHYDNGDGSSQFYFGPLRYGKDGFTAFMAGIFTVPTLATGTFDIELAALGSAYVPLGNWGLIRPATIGIWGGNQGFAVTLIGLDGHVRVNNTVGSPLANAQWGAIAMDWPTGTYGE